MSFLTKDMIIRRKVLPAIVFLAALFAYSGTWRSSVMFPYFESVDLPLSFGLLDSLSAAFGAFTGGFFVDTVKRRKPFFLLFFARSFVILLPFFIKTADIVPVYLFANGILGGLIFTAAFSLFADHTEIFERGRVAGMVWSGFGLLSIIFAIASSWSLDLFFVSMSSLAGVMGIIGLFLVEERTSANEWRKIPMSNIFRDKNFLLYAGVAAIVGFFWMTNTVVVTRYAGDILVDPRFAFRLITASVYLISGFFIGYMIDRFGRRPMIIVGALFFASGFMFFVIYRDLWTLLLTATSFGIGYASTYITTLFVVFGDLAQRESRGRFYGSGMASMIAGSTLGLTAGQILANTSSAIVMAFTVFAAFLIILPVIVAKETLPPKKIVEEMLDYIKEIDEETSKDDESEN